MGPDTRIRCFLKRDCQFLVEARGIEWCIQLLGLLLSMRGVSGGHEGHGENVVLDSLLSWYLVYIVGSLCWATWL